MKVVWERRFRAFPLTTPLLTATSAKLKILLIYLEYRKY